MRFLKLQEPDSFSLQYCKKSAVFAWLTFPTAANAGWHVKCLVLEAVILNNTGLSMLKQDYYYEVESNCGNEAITWQPSLRARIVLL